MIVRQWIHNQRLGQRPLWSPIKEPGDALSLVWLRRLGADSVEYCDVRDIHYVITKSGWLLAIIFKETAHARDGRD